MSSATDGFGPFCGALGCTDGVDIVIDHPNHDHRIVCDDHTGGHEVIRHV